MRLTTFLNLSNINKMEKDKITKSDIDCCILFECNEKELNEISKELNINKLTMIELRILLKQTKESKLFENNYSKLLNIISKTKFNCNTNLNIQNNVLYESNSDELKCLLFLFFFLFRFSFGFDCE